MDSSGGLGSHEQVALYASLVIGRQAKYIWSRIMSYTYKITWRCRGCGETFCVDHGGFTDPISCDVLLAKPPSYERPECCDRVEVIDVEEVDE